MKRLYLAVLRYGMKFYAQHGKWQEMLEEDFLAQEEVQRVLRNAKTFGDKVRLMEDDPNPKNDNILIRQLV